MRYDYGYKLHLAVLSPAYVETTMSDSTFNKIMSNIYIETCGKVKQGLHTQRESCQKLGVRRPFSCCPVGPHHSRQRGIHHVLRIVHRSRRNGDHARRPGDTSFSWVSHRCRHRTMDRASEFTIVKFCLIFPRVFNGETKCELRNAGYAYLARCVSSDEPLALVMCGCIGRRQVSFDLNN